MIFLISAVGTAIAFLGVRAVVNDRTRHLKENYRGTTLIATGGLVLVFALAIGAARITTLGDLDREFAALIGVPAGIAVLGLIDDLYGNRQAGGLLGHARALLRGQGTTGLLKAVGGAVLGLVGAWLLGHRGFWLLVAGAVIALAANMANLLDLRPGRTIKVWLPLALVAILTVDEPVRTVVGAVAGGAIVFLYWELREVAMLGDVGANLLGSVLGVAAAAHLQAGALIVCAAALLAATLVSEVVAFSRVIAAVPPLRWLDDLGRRRS